MTFAWQPIETAPKDGRAILSTWRSVPVFIAYLEIPRKERLTQNAGPFGLFNKTAWTETTESGWFVLSWSPRLGWGVNAGCAAYLPTHWMPLPQPPEQGDRA